MATKFLYSAAGGLNNGNDWTNAWTSIASATGMAAGDLLKAEYRHSQTRAATDDFTNGTRFNPIQIISVDKDNSDAYRAGATINYSGNNTGIRGSVKTKGLTMAGTAAVNCPNTGALASGKADWSNCTFSQTSTGLIECGAPNNGLLINRWLNCTFDLTGGGSSAVAIILAGSQCPLFEFYGCTFKARVAGQTHFFRIDTTQGLDVIFRGCDFQNTVTNLFDSDATDGMTGAIFEDCNLPTFTNVVDTAFGHMRGRIEMRNCNVGTISAPVIAPYQIFDNTGKVVASTAQYRSGGFSDGVTPMSLEFTANASALEPYGYLRGPNLTKRVAAGSQTVTLYLAGNTLQDDEVFADCFSPCEGGSPTAAARFQSSRVVALGTPANLSSDSSTWNGSGVGTVQKITFSINPAYAGLVTVIPYLTKASEVVYVCPKLGIS